MDIGSRLQGHKIYLVRRPCRPSCHQGQQGRVYVSSIPLMSSDHDIQFMPDEIPSLAFGFCHSGLFKCVRQTQSLIIGSNIKHMISECRLPHTKIVACAMCDQRRRASRQNFLICSSAYLNYLACWNCCPELEMAENCRVLSSTTLARPVLP